MAAYVLVQVDVKDPVRYEDYMEGTWSPRRLVVVEFPSVEQAKAWWNSPEYAEAKALRQATSDSQLLIAEGV
jgi:uncharacterized protein (DUF1330 family)